MSELYALLLWLLCVGISAIAIGYYIKYYGLSLPKMNEGFVVITCPANSTKYINKHGDTNCCNGDIVNDECNGNNLCSLSLNNSLGIPNCSDYVNDLANDAATQNCFADMPYYFAASDGSLKGCSAAITTADGTAPSDPGKLQCILYPTAALDEVKLDSCFNYKKNKAALSGANCPVATGGTSGATGAATSGATSAATRPSSILSTVSSVGQQASSVAQGAGSAMDSLFGSRTAAANPTGYVMYGGSISGNLPVAKILGIRGANGNFYGKVYLAQDGPKVRAIMTDTEYTRIYQSISFTMDLSKMTETEFPAQANYPDLRYGMTSDSRYNIKKTDGTGILLSPRKPSSSNPNDYILTGGTPKLPTDLQVTKIINNNKGQILFLAQDGPIIRFAIVRGQVGDENEHGGASSVRGDVSSINNYDSDVFSKFQRETGAGYTIKKKDGTETYDF